RADAALIGPPFARPKSPDLFDRRNHMTSIVDCAEWAAMSEKSRKPQIQPRLRRLPQSLENALGVLVQAIVFALFLAAFIAASEPSAISRDSVQFLQHKKRMPLGVKTMPRLAFLLSRRH